MSIDSKLQQAVLAILRLKRRGDAAHIGVTADDGIVTLTGHVPSFGDKTAAEVATGGVPGVKTVIGHMAIESPGKSQTPDECLAEAAPLRLASSRSVGDERMQITVDGGSITLRGRVDSLAQSEEFETALLALEGVLRIDNQLIVTPSVNEALVREKVNDALHQDSTAHIQDVDVRTEGSQVILSGPAGAWHEMGLAESAARSVPGVTKVTTKRV